MDAIKPLPAARLCWCCAPERLSFESTDDLDDLTEVIGQERAVGAIRFGIGMRRAGFNIYALGPEGIGKHTVAERYLTEQAMGDARPLDWCYVSNFKEPRKPRALQLNAGRGAAFQSDMARFIDDVCHALRPVFESEEYRTRRQVLEEEVKERQEHALEAIEEDAKARGIALMRTPVGFAFTPVTTGKVVSPEVFQRLQLNVEFCDKVRRTTHPLTQTMGVSLATLRDRPARSAASTTSETSL